MFKRALQTNHWMTMGLDEWNKLENMEISQSLIKKYRKVEKGESVDDNEDESDNLSNESQSDIVSDNESIEGDESDQEEVEYDDESSEEEQRVYLRYCESCPGLKFLTEIDFQKHINSKRHQKMLAKTSEPSKIEPVVEVKTPSKPKTNTKKVSETPSTNPNNRKARRAHLASLEKNRPN